MPPALIAVFGLTGAGKTSFINCVTGSKLPVGKGLESCTREVTAEDIPIINIRGVPVQLVDTPGFDDSEVSDTAILRAISEFLAKSYNAGQILTGIVYVHRITNMRMTGSSGRSLRMFRQMCGEYSFHRVMFLTTMWSSPPTQGQLDTERELRDHPLISQFGAWARIITRTPSEGMQILEWCLNGEAGPLHIQEMMVDQGVPLHNTNAFQAAHEGQEEQWEQWEQRERKKEIIYRAFAEGEERRKKQQADERARQEALRDQHVQELTELHKALAKEREEKARADEQQRLEKVRLAEHRNALEAEVAEAARQIREEAKRQKALEQQAAIMDRKQELERIKEEGRKRKGKTFLKAVGVVAVAFML